MQQSKPCRPDGGYWRCEGGTSTFAPSGYANQSPKNFPHLTAEQQQQLIERILAGPHDEISIDPGAGEWED